MADMRLEEQRGIIFALSSLKQPPPRSIIARSEHFPSHVGAIRCARWNRY